MQLQNGYLVMLVMLLLCSRCGKAVILNVFKTPMLCNFCLFFKLFLVFVTAQWRLRHTGSSGLARDFECGLYRRTRGYLL